MKKSVIILTVILIVIISGGTFLLGFLVANNFQFSTKPILITPTLDGIIEKKEWNRATYYNLPFYLDVDNSIDPYDGKSNVDGWNYLSVAEDENWYYVSLDLCSDRTSNLVDEWISFFLANRMPYFLQSELALHALVDRGFEYVFYNVETDTVFADDQDSSFASYHFYEIPIVPETDLISVLNGNTESTYLDFWRVIDSKNYTVESIVTTPPGGIWLEGNYVDLQFGIDIDEKMPNIDTASFMAAISDLDLNMRITANLTADYMNDPGNAERFWCTVHGHGPMAIPQSSASYLSNTHYVDFDADTYINVGLDFDHNDINATDGMYYFAIHCWNELNATDPTAYELYIDRMSLHIITKHYYTTRGSTIAPANYDIAWSFGSSEMCAEDHRMFEFRFAKSELPNVADEMLYLCVAGYGTLAMTGTSFWQYPQFGEPLSPIIQFLDSHNDFLVLDMSIT